MPRILITGGTGFIGSALIDHLIASGHELAVLSRKPLKSKNPKLRYYQWDIDKKVMDPKSLENVNHIINLVGAYVGSKRWTKKRKQEILDSRLEPLKLLYDNVASYGSEIKTLISSSAVGYYGTFKSEGVLSEDDPNGNDFMAEVCRQWEEAAFAFQNLGNRVVVLRKAAVLGKESEMYKQMSAFAKYGINTAVGDGKQYIPWVYIKDLLRLYSVVLNEQKYSGVFNAVSSAHTDMNEFATALSKAMNRPILTPNAPAFIIKLLYGELSQMLLFGNKISNSKLQNFGFGFQFNNIFEVLKEIASGK